MNRPDDRGSVTLIALGFVGVFALVCAVLYDGGMRLVAKQRALDEAGATARRALAHIDVEHDADGGLVLDAKTAEDDAMEFLDRFGHDGTVSVDGTTVTVTVTIDYEARLLPLFSGPVEAAATASPLDPITGGR